jgi:threonine/homoserine/homoserine lactone efflux protein
MASAAWRSGTAPADAAAQPPRPLAAEFRTGLLTNVLNPKVALFFLAFLPQFIAADAPHKTLAFLVMGAVFVVQGLLFLLAVVAVVGRWHGMPLRPSTGRWLNGAGALLFTLLALRLATSRVGAAA